MQERRDLLAREIHPQEARESEVAGGEVGVGLAEANGKALVYGVEVLLEEGPVLLGGEVLVDEAEELAADLSGRPASRRHRVGEPDCSA